MTTKNNNANILKIFVPCVVALLTVIFDQLSKIFIQSIFEVGDSVVVIPGVLNFTYVQSEKSIYRDKVKIAEKITDFSAQKDTINKKDVIKITIGTGKEEADFGKTINYVLKYW